MMVTVLVNLYTSRVILKTLGVSDFGVYNVMGGTIGYAGVGKFETFVTLKENKDENNSFKYFRFAYWFRNTRE